MKLPLNWLHDYCKPVLSATELADRLDLTGTAVEHITTHGVGETENFVVGKVLSAEKHPDADRLSVCTVDTGDGEPRQIVCGAPNVAAGQTVAVAKPGAVMPDGTKLKKAKLRGVASEGMILAEDELQLGTGHSGILVLDDAVAAGTPLADVLPIRTDVLELEITSNRPDCLGIYGVAREVHAATGADLASPPWLDDLGAEWPSGADLDLAGAKVVVETPELCPRFTARVFENVTVGPSPLWLKARLMAAGQRPISNVVDITNYVMLVTGQPLHSFDLDKVSGKRLTIRCAKPGETVTTLDGIERSCNSETVLVCDDDGPAAVAGIMGGSNSEVSSETTSVLMEVATWNGPNIHASSLKLGLRSEASTRFEKQLSPESTLEAQALATKLMVELCGARPVEGTIDIDNASSASLKLELAETKLNSLLGTQIPIERAGSHLQSLGFTVELDGQSKRLVATVPHYRAGDVIRPIDLIEEIARIEGLEKIPATLPARRHAVGGLTKEQKLVRKAEDFLVGAGLCEIVGWSFVSSNESAYPPVDPLFGSVQLANPMSSEQSVLRTTLLQSLMRVATHNYAQGSRSFGIFESGTVYLDTPQDHSSRQRPFTGKRRPPVCESRSIAGLLVGSPLPVSWRSPIPEGKLDWWERGTRSDADLFTVKSLVVSLLEALKVDRVVVQEGMDQHGFVPGRVAEVCIGSDLEYVGFFGELLPSAPGGIGATAVAFELELGKVLDTVETTPQYRDLIAYPPVKEDLSLVVAEESYITGGGEVVAEYLIQSVKRHGAPLVESVEVFDFYRSEDPDESKISIGLRLSYRSQDRTLTGKEIAKVRARVIAGLELDWGAQLRD